MTTSEQKNSPATKRVCMPEIRETGTPLLSKLPRLLDENEASDWKVH
jgi:hypothetical protein